TKSALNAANFVPHIRHRRPSTSIRPRSVAEIPLCPVANSDQSRHRHHSKPNSKTTNRPMTPLADQYSTAGNVKNLLHSVHLQSLPTSSSQLILTRPPIVRRSLLTNVL